MNVKFEKTHYEPSQSRFIVWIFLFLCFSISLQAIETTKLTCEFQQRPLAVNTLQPRFGWQFSSAQNGYIQSAYELEIKSENFYWNSGRIITDKSQLVKYTGEALKHGQKYDWRVRVWDKNDLVSAWSPWTIFRIAPVFMSSTDGLWIGAIRSDSARLPIGRRFSYLEMKDSDYKAIWQNTEPLSKQSILIRKSCLVPKQVKEAITYICGLGHYELSINGEKVSDGEFAPFWSDYDKTVYYNSFDVTEFLKKGENVFGILLGNGFYNTQGGRYSKLKVTFGAPTLFFKTIIYYSDNTTDEIISDQTWKYALSPITFNDIYGGEDYDARIEQKAWDLPKFNDKNWKKVVVQDAPKGYLTPQQGNPIKIMEKLNLNQYKITYLFKDSLGKFSKTHPSGGQEATSSMVFDMVQNLAGFPEITVKGKKGDTISILVSETLYPDGSVDQRQTGRPHIYTYICKGEGDEIWHPRFSYYSFRYIQVEGAVYQGDKNPHKLPVLKDIKSCFVYNSSPETSSFECSNELFNKTHVLIEKAVKSNMQAVMTDCPHREKLGWTEQLHLNGPVLLYNYDLAAFIPKVIKDLVDAQRPDGAVPSIAPMYNVFGDKSGKLDNFGVSPEWGSSILLLPWIYYEFYGDSSLIVNNYQSIRRWVDYLSSRAENHVLSFGLGDWYDYGDFRAGFSRNTAVPFVATAYYFYVLKYFVKSAELVGNQYDVEYYAKLAEQVREVLNSQFFDSETKQYSTGSQTANAMAVYMGIVQAENKHAVLDNLVKDIKTHGNRLTTGDIGNRYLFQTLATNNLNELMYTLFNHDEAPGYGFQLKYGATTLTEQWDPREGASKNHFMLGQIDEWFFGSLAGIQAKKNNPGMQHFIIKPEPVGDLKFVKASIQTLFGKISVHWKKEATKFTMNIVVPANCTADVYLPGEHEPKVVGSGYYTFLK